MSLPTDCAMLKSFLACCLSVVPSHIFSISAIFVEHFFLNFSNYQIDVFVLYFIMKIVVKILSQKLTFILLNIFVLAY